MVKLRTFFFYQHRREIRKYALFGLGTGLAVIATTSIDTIMIASLIDLKQTGAYSIALFIGNAIAAPLVAMGAITGPVIARHWNNNDYQAIKELYRSTSRLLFFVGMVMYSLVAVSMKDLLNLLPAEQDLSVLFLVFMFLGAAQILNMVASISHQVIHYSNRYYFNFWASLFLAIFNIVLNLYFVLHLQMGIIGVAMATLLSTLIFNIIRIGFIYHFFKMSPFTKHQVIFTSFIIILLLILFNIRIEFGSILNILTKSVVLLSVIAIYLRFVNIVPEVNTFVLRFLRKTNKIEKH